MPITITAIDQQSGIKSPFYEDNPLLVLNLNNLTFWQLMQLKKFARETSLMFIESYGVNPETNQCLVTLKVSKLKIWTKEEQEEFSEIVGKGVSNFSLYF